jgi:hypothetical protein
VTFFDCLHDMGDPTGAAEHVLSTLKQDGTWMIVEPFANDRPEENHNPVGRIFYSASTMICTPASLAQEVGAGLGAQAGEECIRHVVTSGFKRFRRAAQTPFNLVLKQGHEFPEETENLDDLDVVGRANTRFCDTTAVALQRSPRVHVASN